MTGRSSARSTLVSLFAGAGGLDLGLENAGFTTVFANEIEPHAAKTLAENQRLARLKGSEFDRWFAETVSSQRCYETSSPTALMALKERIRPTAKRDHSWLQQAHVACMDVRSLTGASISEVTGLSRGELTLMAGGPPCQPFSRAGKRETVAVADGRLFLEFVRLVDELRPRWFLFENVKGLLLHRTEVAQARCISCGTVTIPPFSERESYLTGEGADIGCQGCGRIAKVEVQSPADGSLHLIMAEFKRIGYSCDWRVLNAADYGVPQLRHRLFIVGSRDNEPTAWPVATHVTLNESGAVPQPDLFANGAAPKEPWVTMRESLWPQGHWRYGRLDPRTARLWVKNVVRPHAEPVTWTLDRPAPTIGAHQAAKLAIAPNGVPEEQLSRQQWHVKGRRQGDRPPVFVEHEYLSDEELLHLQTFPPAWYLHGTRMQRAFQVGNAVPVALAAAMGRCLLRTSHTSVSTLESAVAR